MAVDLVAMVFCFIGVLAIAMNKKSSGDEENGELLGIIVTLSFAWNFSALNICNRMLKEVNFASVGVCVSFYGMFIMFVYFTI